MNTKEKLIIILVLAIVAMSFVYSRVWTCTIDILARTVAHQIVAHGSLSILADGLSHFDLLI
jgi:hypothetical protein